MSKDRFAMFLIVVLSIWAAVHLYVFWRVASLPWASSHLSHGSWALLAAALWASYPLARLLNAGGWGAVGRPLEFAAAVWIGGLFLVFSSLLTTDVLTAGGWFLPRLASRLRGWAVLGAGVLTVAALAQ